MAAKKTAKKSAKKTAKKKSPRKAPQTHKKPRKPNPAAFKPGNKLWQLRENMGKPRSYKNAAELWNACVAYFEWCEDNPILEMKAFVSRGTVKTKQIPLMRAMTKDGLFVHIGISPNTWENYKEWDGWNKERTKYSEIDDYLSVITIVEKIIREQKFTGAASGMLNARIISQDLGLIQKQEVAGPNQGPVQAEITNTWNVLPVASAARSEDE